MIRSQLPFATTLASLLGSLCAPALAQGFRVVERTTSAIPTAVAAFGARGMSAGAVGLVPTAGGGTQTHRYDYGVDDWVLTSAVTPAGLSYAPTANRAGTAFAIASTGNAFEWDDATPQWVAAGLTNSPTTIINIGMAAMPDGTLVVFGGNVAGAATNETWLLAPGSLTWQQLLPPIGASLPSARQLPRMATVENGVLLFGGISTVAEDDTWFFDGSTWTELFPPTTPPARFAHGMGGWASFDAATIFGGLDGTGAAVTDCWVFLNNNWRFLGATTGGVIGGCGLHEDSLEVLGGPVPAVGTTHVSINSSTSVNLGCACPGVVGNFAMATNLASTLSPGGVFTLNIRGFEGGLPVFLLGGNGDAVAPSQLPTFPIGCNTVLPAFDLIELVSLAPAAGTTLIRTDTFPGGTALIGVGTTWQAVQITTTGAGNCASNSLEVFIGR